MSACTLGNLRALRLPCFSFPGRLRGHDTVRLAEPRVPRLEEKAFESTTHLLCDAEQVAKLLGPTLDTSASSA